MNQTSTQTDSRTNNSLQKYTANIKDPFEPNNPVPKREDKDIKKSLKSITTTDTDNKQQARHIGDKLETLKPANLNRYRTQSGNLRTRASPNTNNHCCKTELPEQRSYCSRTSDHHHKDGSGG
jgi:hypothetical protein